MDSHVYPPSPSTTSRCARPASRTFIRRSFQELKAGARKRGLWNLFHPHPEWGPGLTNLEYALFAEIIGRSHIASEACNSSAPDTGNMEVFTRRPLI
jgi:acyl-CoA dehydrogenase